jgi:multiple sugar transport system ATP-binding protein
MPSKILPKLFLFAEPLSKDSLRCKSEVLGPFTLPLRVNGSVEGKSLTLGVRPEHVRLETAGGALGVSGVVNIVEHLGSETFIHSSVGASGLVVAKTSGSAAPERNTRLQLYFPLEHLYLVNDNEQAIAAQPAA